MTTATPQQKKRRIWAMTSASGVFLAGVIVVLVNVLANWVFFRLDMTQQGAYSLSPSSKRLVRSLEDPVVIKAYFSPDLPPPYNAYERYVRDMLTEYRAASKGRVRFEFVLTHPSPSFEQAAMEANLAPLQFEQMGSDQLQIRRGFMGLVIQYRNKSETLPVIKRIDGIEYDVTRRTCVPDLARRLGGVVHDEVVGDRQDRPPKGDQLVVAGPVTLPVGQGGVPQVAVRLDGKQHVRVGEIEEHLAAVEHQYPILGHRERQASLTKSPEEARLELAAHRPCGRRPLVEQLPQDVVVPASRGPRLEAGPRDEPASQGVVEHRPNLRRRVDPRQVDDGPLRRRRRNPLQPGEVLRGEEPGPVGDDALQLDPAGPRHGDLHPSRCSRHAKQSCRGSIRRHRAVPSRQGPGHHPLLKGALAPGEAVGPP